MKAEEDIYSSCPKFTLKKAPLKTLYDFEPKQASYYFDRA